MEGEKGKIERRDRETKGWRERDTGMGEIRGEERETIERGARDKRESERNIFARVHTHIHTHACANTWRQSEKNIESYTASIKYRNTVNQNFGVIQSII